VSERLDTGRIASELRNQGREAESFDNPGLIAARLGDESREGDVVLVMSNGDFGDLIPKFLERLEERS
jgi:UDP-N-acetylmuramate: L-alanyl-gamma-D-glutamyl-meso-diaminopimelate ligase